MSYPIEYDELLTRSELMNGLSGEFDNIHNHLREMRRSNPRDVELRPHKVAKYINAKLSDYIRNHKPEHLQTNQSTNQDDCTHVLSNILGDTVMGCELCPKTFHINEVNAECVS